MDQIIYKEIENDQETWKKYFEKFPVQQIKILKEIGEKVWIEKPTGFLLHNGTCHVLGYTTAKNVFYDTNRLKPNKISPYTSNKLYVTRRQFHDALFWRIDLLDKLNINISDVQYFEISRRCLFLIFMDLEMTILYERELKLLRKLKVCNREFYDKIVHGDFYKKMYELYHNYTYRENDFNYTDHVMSVTYKWKISTE